MAKAKRDDVYQRLAPTRELFCKRCSTGGHSLLFNAFAKQECIGCRLANGKLVEQLRAEISRLKQALKKAR